MTDFQTAISSLAEQLYGDAPAPQQEAAQEPTEGVTEGAEPETQEGGAVQEETCLLYTSPSPRDGLLSRMPSSA